MHLAPDVVVDRYRVLAPLGRGGMAEVWLVRHEQLGTSHALKVLSVASADLRQRLLLEGRAQAALRHPNIVAVSDVVDLGGPQGLVMEYVAGPSLDRWLQRARPSLAQADSLARGILAGVAAAHRLGVVHRDLKPGNVLVQSEHDDVRAKVADFGLAKVLGGSGGAQTRSGAAMGTPSYMAPEQIRDAKGVDARADVFALGAILYALLTGILAFPGEDLVSLHERMSRRGYRPLAEVRPDAPARWVAAIEAALAPDPADRPTDATALLALWAAGAGGLPDPWSESDREALREMAPAGPGTPSLEPPVSSDPTWDPGMREAAAPSVAQAPLAPPPSAPLSQVSAPDRRPLAALGLIGVALIGGVALLATRETPAPLVPAASIAAPPPVAPTEQGFTRTAVPPIAAPAAVSQQFDGAWFDLLAGEAAEARAGAEAVAIAAPDEVAALVLLAATRWITGDEAGGAKAIAAAQARAGESPGAANDAARTLAVHADGQPALLGRVATYTERYPEDWLVPIAAAFAPGDLAAGARSGRLGSRIAQDDRAPAGAHWAQAAVLLRFSGPVGEARRVAEAGLALHVANPALTLALAEAALALGEPAVARDALSPMVQAGRSRPEVRAWLAAATRLAGDAEGADRLVAPLVDPAQASEAIQVMAWRNEARVAAGQGRLGAARAALNAARAAAGDDGPVIDDALDLALVANDADIYREVLTWEPAGARRWVAVGHLAALEGRAADASAALTALAATGESRVRVGRLSLVLLTPGFDPKVYLAALQDARPGCLTSLLSARASAASGDKQTARGAYYDAMMSCGRWGPENLAGAEAALVTVEKEDELRIARNLMTVFAARLPEPDAGLGLWVRAQKERARISE